MSLVEGSQMVPGRSCAGCTLCCKLLKIEELQKPRDAWCAHCAVDRGCRIYPERPETCRRFECGYLTNAALGEEWRPSKCKIILVSELQGTRLSAYVDPQRPDAWRQEPYHAALRGWSRAALPRGGQVLACVGRRTYAILPDRDIDLGIVPPGDLIVTERRRTPAGLQFEVYAIPKDDPRAQQLLARRAAGARDPAAD